MAALTEAHDRHPARHTVALPVTSARDGLEHLVVDEAITPGNSGYCVAFCGRAVWAAALVCPPGPQCPACIAVRDADAGSKRRRHRQRLPVWWTRLNLVRRGRHRAAGTTDGAPDAN